jgi:hypothetical protein
VGGLFIGDVDLEEILYLLRDRPSGSLVRSSKTRAMFAMRACRKSTMVGAPLNAKQMRTVSFFLFLSFSRASSHITRFLCFLYFNCGAIRSFGIWERWSNRGIVPTAGRR